ncbi:MAG: hypothetical protein ACRDPI_06585 [Nocardioidaceae bacterium]
MTTHPPTSLVTAAGLVGIEALGVVGYGVALVPAVHASRLALGLTTAVFFIGYGVALAFCARSLVRLRSWARSPLVLSQLLQLGLAYNFWSGNGTLRAISAALAVVAVVVLAALFLPASTRALETVEEAGPDG